MGRQRSTGHPHVQRRVRPRYGRIWAAGTSFGVTLVAVLGSAGLVPLHSAEAASSSAAPKQSGAGDTARLAGRETATTPTPTSTTSPTGLPAAHETASSPAAVPADSGAGKRVVFDMSAQRVWLVTAHDDTVLRTYPVSGSVTDNLQPGTYAVYSRSLHAVGVDDSGTMRYMVRFAHGENAAIGFHDIPVKDGRLVQRRSDLGTPESHGCIRQWRPDARALWRFAQLGTMVVVVA
jgi:hypothetical protein